MINLDTLTSTRNTKFDNAKAFLILTVVVGHFANVDNPAFSSLRPLSFWIYIFHIPLFIFLSGFFSKHIVESKERVIKKAFEFFSLNVFLKVALFVTGHIYRGSATFLLSKQSGVTWYLVALAVMYIIAYILRNIDKKAILIFSIVMGLMCGYDKSIDSTFALSKIITFFPFFVAGLMFDKEKLESILNKKSVKVAAVAVLATTFILCIIFIDNLELIRPLLTNKSPYSKLKNSVEDYAVLLRTALYILSSTMGISILALSPNKQIDYFTSIGERTMSVYFWHYPVMYLILATPFVDMITTHLHEAAYIMIWLLLSVLLTALLGLKIFKKPFDMWHNLING